MKQADVVLLWNQVPVYNETAAHMTRAGRQNDLIMYEQNTDWMNGPSMTAGPFVTGWMFLASDAPSANESARDVAIATQLFMRNFNYMNPPFLVFSEVAFGMLLC